MWWKDRHLKSEDVNQRLKATQALDATRGTRAFDSLVTALTDEHVDVRCTAAEALGRSGDPRAVEPLVHALETADLRTAQAAETALQELNWNPVDARQRARRAIVTRRFETALAEGADGVEPLIDALADANEDGRKADLVTALGRTCDTRILPPLGELVKDDPNPAVRTAAAHALGVIGDFRGIESLVVALADDDTKVRASVVESLVKIGSPCTELLSEYLGHIKPTVRAAAANALGQIHDIRTARSLLWALKDPQVDVRSAAASALRNSEDSTAIEPLIAALTDEHWSVRRSAAAALGQIGDHRAVEPLMIALNDQDIWVRSQATEALSRVGDGRAVSALLRSLQETGASIIGVDDSVRISMRIAAARGLGRIGSEAAVEALLETHRERVPHLRDAADAAILDIGSVAVEYLAQLIETETDLAERRWAAEMLGRIGDPMGLPVLITLLTDPKAGLRAAAAEALGAIGDPRAIDPLTRALEDPDVRTTAGKALHVIQGATARTRSADRAAV